MQIMLRVAGIAGIVWMVWALVAQLQAQDHRAFHACTKSYSYEYCGHTLQYFGVKREDIR